MAPILRTSLFASGVACMSATRAAISADSYCGLVMNSSLNLFSFSTIDNSTGAISNIIELQLLDSFGDSISAGAQYGRYYTVSGNVTEQTEFLVVDVGDAPSARWVNLTLPSAYSDVTLYGIGSINVDPVTQEPVMLVLGFTAAGQRRAFVGIVNSTSGAVTKVLVDLSQAYATWVFLYAGVTAWDAASGMYYLSSVTGSHDITYLYGFNTSLPSPDSGTPVLSLPVDWGVGDYTALGLSPALARMHGGPGLVALVDDDENSAAALWLLGPDAYRYNNSPEPVARPQLTAKGHQAADSDAGVTAPPSPWLALYQYPDDTLEFSGNNGLELSTDGLTAYSVFYDNHTPIANQIVSRVDLARGTETGRTAVQGSQMGTAIADIALCPGQ